MVFAYSTTYHRPCVYRTPDAIAPIIDEPPFMKLVSRSRLGPNISSMAVFNSN